VTKARQELALHDQARDQAIAESQASKQAASDAAYSASMADDRAKTAEAQAKTEHDELQRAANENAKLRPQAEKLKSLSGHWGINAILFGIGLLVKHILIMIAVIAVLVLILWVASMFVPWLAPVGNLFRGLIARIILIFKPKPKTL
jgi:uncharacterized membrane protein